jgi:hypothetical protein
MEKYRKSVKEGRETICEGRELIGKIKICKIISRMKVDIQTAKYIYGRETI